MFALFVVCIGLLLLLFCNKKMQVKPQDDKIVTTYIGNHGNAIIEFLIPVTTRKARLPNIPKKISWAEVKMKTQEKKIIRTKIDIAELLNPLE